MIFLATLSYPQTWVCRPLDGLLRRLPLPQCHPSVAELLQTLRPGLLGNVSDALAKLEKGEALAHGITKFSAEVIAPKAIALRIPLSESGSVVVCAWPLNNRWLLFFARETSGATSQIDVKWLQDGQNALIELLDMLGSGK